MNLLFITEIAPFPPNGGEKLRSYGLLRLLSGLNLNVQAIIGKSAGDPSNPVSIQGIQFQTFDFGSILSDNRLVRYCRLFRPNRELLALIDNILKENAVDIAYIDYHLYGQYISHFKKRDIPVIYGTHNAQARLIYQRPAVSFRNRITLFTDYLLNRLHEWWFFRKADAIIVVSEGDKQYHRRFLPRKPFFVIPNFLVESEYPNVKVDKEEYIIMSANFKAFQNHYGLEWFLREVWNEKLWTRAQLRLIGIGSDEALQGLKDRYDCTNIIALGAVDDLKPHITKARVSIVPLLHGSGSRLKCIESMALRTQLVSTTKGAEGLVHNQAILLADTPDEFRSELMRVLDLRCDHTEAAYQAFLENYSQKPNARIFVSILDLLHKPGI